MQVGLVSPFECARVCLGGMLVGAYSWENRTVSLLARGSEWPIRDLLASVIWWRGSTALASIPVQISILHGAGDADPDA